MLPSPRKNEMNTLKASPPALPIMHPSAIILFSPLLASALPMATFGKRLGHNACWRLTRALHTRAGRFDADPTIKYHPVMNLEATTAHIEPTAGRAPESTHRAAAWCNGA